MRCKACGADYDSKFDNCPFCNSENDVKAARKIEEELNKYDEEAEDMEELPRKVSSFSGKIIFAIFILAGIIVVLVVLFSDSLFSKNEETQETKQDSNVVKHIEKLENLLEDKDYKGIDDYLYEENLYGSDYRKYSEVGNTYQYYDWMCEDIKWLETMRDEGTKWSIEQKKDTVQMVLYDGLRCLHEINEYCMDRIPRKNEEYLQEIYDMTLSELNESIGLDKEECEEMIDVDEISKYHVSSYVDDIYESYFK